MFSGTALKMNVPVQELKTGRITAEIDLVKQCTFLVTKIKIPNTGLFGFYWL